MRFSNAPGAAEVERIVEHIGGDHMLLFATDFPHHHFEGTASLPPGLSAEGNTDLRRGVMASRRVPQPCRVARTA